MSGGTKFAMAEGITEEEGFCFAALCSLGTEQLDERLQSELSRCPRCEL